MEPTKPVKKPLKGIVLAGGHSRRFGEDKALALIDGVPMLQKIVDLLSQCDLEPCVITNNSKDYSFLNCRVERDKIVDKGPLGGIYTACCLFKDSVFAVLTCDMPALNPDAIGSLVENYHPTYRVHLFSNQPNHYQPFPGIYDATLREPILKSVKDGQLSMQTFLQSLPDVQILNCPFDKGAFLNVNERSDL